MEIKKDCSQVIEKNETTQVVTKNETVCETIETYEYDKAEASWLKKQERNFVEVDCKCAMSDPNTGFCSSVIGTEFYQKALRSELYVLKQSKCHTLDRHNMRA
jgi:hypothetical protein